MGYLPFVGTAKRVWRARDGLAALEFAVTLPVLTYLVAQVVALGSLMLADMQVENAARAGAAYAQNYGFDQTRITNAINAAVTSRSDLVIQATPAPSQSYGCPDASQGIVLQAAKTPKCSGGAEPGRYVIVNTQATYTYPAFLVLPGFGGQVTLTGKAMARID
jgi:Flp pilus assembly protein TadG